MSKPLLVITAVVLLARRVRRLERVAGAPPDLAARCAMGRRGGAQQAGLADAGLACHEHDVAARTCAVEQRLQRSQCGFSFDEVGHGSAQVAHAV